MMSIIKRPKVGSPKPKKTRGVLNKPGKMGKVTPAKMKSLSAKKAVKVKIGSKIG